MQQASPYFIRAVLMTVAAFTMIVPGMDAIAKLLTESTSPLVIAWARFALTLVILAPVVAWRGGMKAFLPRPLAPYIWRGLGLTIATWLFFIGVQYMPLTDMVAIFFISPFILTIISAGFLGETFGWRRGIAIVVGFCGALLVIRPSFTELGLVALLPAGAAVAFSIQTAVTKSIAHKADPWVIQVLSGVVGTVTLGAVMLYEGTSIPFAEYEFREYRLYLTLVGFAILSHSMLIPALKHMDAGVFAPLQYLEIVGATIYGFLLFGDFPDRIRWIGIAIVVASGLFIVLRERSLEREEGS